MFEDQQEIQVKADDAGNSVFRTRYSSISVFRGGYTHVSYGFILTSISLEEKGYTHREVRGGISK